ncbi:MAG: hypothetical protein BBJ60_09250 [Desulfobacterales bacterium S7086C20]|nr:MAG: hypothetical protein BBJ60_09250 [Desulfobacterales bacterium S7086C20]
MRRKHRVGLLIGLILNFIAINWFINCATASECIKCHTDEQKLKSITKDLPKKEKSTETAGKG